MPCTATCKRFALQVAGAEALLITGWFDERISMTPEELLTVPFPRSRLGRRGYEEAAVRNFLLTVHGEFVRLQHELPVLHQEIQLPCGRLLAGSDQVTGWKDVPVHEKAALLARAGVISDWRETRSGLVACVYRSQAHSHNTCRSRLAGRDRGMGGALLSG